MKKQIQWIDSLKLIAAFAVFWGHFFMTFLGSRPDYDAIQGATRKIILIWVHIFNLFKAGDYWVFVFCLIAGYFAARKKIATFKDLIKAIIHRYFRFVIPILFTNIFAWIIWNTFGYQTQIWKELVGSTWVGEAYAVKLGIVDVFKSAFLLTHQFSGPFWVIRPIFYGSVIVYVYSYIKSKVEETKVLYLPDVIMMILLWMSFVNQWMYANLFRTMVLAVGGVLLKYIWDNIIIPKEMVWMPTSFLLITFLTHDIYPTIAAKENSIIAFFFVLSLFYSGIVIKALECDVFKKTSNLSFGIFALHGPILFSLGIWIQRMLMKRMPYALSISINLVVLTFVVLVAAYIFRYVVEDMIMKRIFSSSLIRRK